MPSPDAPWTMEIRKMLPSDAQALGQILDIRGEWKILMGEIPRQWSRAAATHRNWSKKRFRTTDIQAIEYHLRNSPQAQTAFEVILDEWGTMSSDMERPDLRFLLELLIRINSLRAASYVAEKILKIGQVTEANKYQVLMECESNALDDFVEVENEVASEIQAIALVDHENSDVLNMPVPPENDFTIPHVKYLWLRNITAGFGAQDESRLIGKGGYSEVFLGVTDRSRTRLAVKRLVLDKPGAVKPVTDLLNTEVGQVSRMNHPNILEIVGYSNDGESCCLVYPFMDGGNLASRLKQGDQGHNQHPPLSAAERLSVLLGVASGLEYMHSGKVGKKLLHRDIKPQNILLNEDLVPKIADFGLLRFASTTGNTMASMAAGTALYMAPEAFRAGNTEVTVDVYSFGVVVLETVSGRPPICRVGPEDEDAEDIVSFALAIWREGGPAGVAAELVDPEAGFRPDVGKGLNDLSQHCLKNDKAERPLMPGVCQRLRELAKMQMEEQEQ